MARAAITLSDDTIKVAGSGAYGRSPRHLHPIHSLFLTFLGENTHLKNWRVQKIFRLGCENSMNYIITHELAESQACQNSKVLPEVLEA